MIRKLYLDNYKAFESTFFHFEKLNIFVGENSAGKSAVIDAIGSINENISVEFANTTFENVSYNSLVTQKNKKKGYFSIGYTYTNSKTKEPIGVLIKIVEKEGLPIAKAAFVYYSKKRILTVSRKRGKYISHSFNTDISYANFEEFISDNKNKKISSFNFDTGDKIIFDYRKVLLNYTYYIGLQKLYDKGKDGYLDFDFMVMNATDSFKKIEEIRKIPTGASQIRKSEYDPYGGDVISRFKKVQDEDRDKYNAINAFGRSNNLFEEIRVVNQSTRHLYNYQYLIVKNNNKSVPIEYVGTGVSQIIPILIEIQHGDNLLVKQPELHLHPSIQYSLGKYIYNNIFGQIFIETHSRFIVDSIRKSYSISDKNSKKKIKLYFFKNENMVRKVSDMVIENDGSFSGDAIYDYNKFIFEYTVENLFGNILENEN